MARPPLALGTPGTIKVAEESKGVWSARCRFRDYDGVTRRVAKFAATKTAARTALHKALEERQRGGVRSNELAPSSTFAEAAALFLRRSERRCQDTTVDIYRGVLDGIVLPALGALRLRECTVSRLDAFFGALEARYAPNTLRSVRTVVSGVLRQAVLYEAIAHNPVRELERIEQPRGQRKAGPRGLTAAERRMLLTWIDGWSPDARVQQMQRRARDAELPDLIRFFLGTGTRIGEAMATRRLDVNLDGVPVQTPDGERRVPVVTVAGNIAYVKGKGLVRHEGKSDAALRMIPLPEFAAEMVRERLAAPGDPEWPLFPTAGVGGQVTYRWPANVRRSLRPVRQELGLDWMTPHTWRRTYATILDDEISFTERMKADLMGHARFLKNEYVSRGELHPDAAVVLDAAVDVR